MEEQRISRMYLNLIARWFTGLWERIFPGGFWRSRLTFLAGLAALVLVPSLGWYLHQHGKFHSAKQDLGVSSVPEPPAAPRPGGAEAMLLTRPATLGSVTPELLSVTLVPGLGMGVLQITANLPGRGELPLLANPTLQDLADNSTLTRSYAGGDHGSLQLPWAGTLSGQVAPLGTTLQTTWHGRSFSVSRSSGERSGVAGGGMLYLQPADTVQSTSGGEGMQGQADFQATNFNDHWPSKTEIHVTARLNARTLELSILAKNVGTEPEPLGIGWFPRFLFPATDRGTLELRLPKGELMEVGDRTRGLPSGRFLPAPESSSRFQGRSAPLGTAALDQAFAHLQPALQDASPVAELRDPASGFGLRLSALSASIKELHLATREGGDYVAIGMQTNYDDAFGKEWNGDGIATLAPGESLEWKIRLEIFPLTRR